MRRPIGNHIARLYVASIALLVAGVAGCGSDPTVPRTVPVDFELQAINADMASWGFGISGGRGDLGFGGVNETQRGTFEARVGDPVFCKASGEQWDDADPGHQLICRIIVDDEEIYMCADQGTPNEDTAIECGGPVYLPKEEDG